MEWPFLKLELLFSWLGNAWVLKALNFLLILAAGFAIGNVLSRLLRGLGGLASSPQRLMIIRKLTFYAAILISLVFALNAVGVDWRVLVGTAGLFSVAIGFAAQTSFSNLISGIFMMGEQPFVVGDIIRVGEITGVVLSIDLLSTRLRTFDNLMVRIPNESLMKANMTNLTHFPIRRVDVQVRVAYKENLRQVNATLVDLAAKNPLMLDEPTPLFLIQGFGESGLNLQFSVWTQREHFLEVKNAIHEGIKDAFETEGIEIPFPHRTLHASTGTTPIPVRIIKDMAS